MAGTAGVSTFKINSKFVSGNLVFYEEDVGRTATGDVFTIGTAAVKVGGTGQDVDFQVYGTGSLSAIIDIGAATFTLIGIASTSDGQLKTTLATDASSLTTGSITTAGGVSIAKQLYLGDDLDMSVNGTGVYDITLKTNVADALSITDGTDIIVFETTTGAPTITITPATTITGVLTSNGGITMGDAKNIATNATTGTKVGTATSQKIGFWNVTPVIQQAHIADAAGGGTVDAEARTAIASINALCATLGLTAAA